MAAKSGRITNPYGYVDEDAREFVITRPDTPTPWINYLGEGRYGGIVSRMSRRPTSPPMPIGPHILCPLKA